MEARVVSKIVENICTEENIELVKFSYDWVLRLEKYGKIKYIVENKFDLNTICASQVVSDKYATFCVLDKEKIPAVKHQIVFNPNTRGEYIDKSNQKDNAYLENKKDGSIVIKSNCGNSGKEVFLVSDIDKYNEVTERLFSIYDNVSVCPFYNIKYEYRCVYLDGEILLIYGKEKPYIVGDGVSTIIELIKKDELLYGKYVQRNERVLDENRILKIDEKYEISWKFNLSLGAKSFIVEDEKIKNELEKLAKKARKSFRNEILYN